MLAGAGCTPEKDFMPDGPSMTARVSLVDQDVGLLTETKGEPCYELRTDVVKGAEASLGQYGCVQARDALSVDLLVYPDYEAPAASGFTTPVLVVHERLAVGGAVAPSVVTVTVNGQPSHRDGPYFLAVLPTIPDGDVTVVAADRPATSWPAGSTPGPRHCPEDPGVDPGAVYVNETVGGLSHPGIWATRRDRRDTDLLMAYLSDRCSPDSSAELRPNHCMACPPRPSSTT